MLGRLLGGTESRAYSPTSIWMAGGMVPVTTSSGVSITQESALRINAVYAAVRLISDSIAMLPLDTFYRAGGERRPFRPKPEWVEFPDADGGTRQAFLTQWLLSKLTAQAACIRILRDGNGDVVAFSALDPRLVERTRDERGRIVNYYDNRKYAIADEDMIYDAEIVRAGSLTGISRVDELKETFGLTEALQSFSARFFGNGSTIGGVIEVPGDITSDQAKGLQDGWEAGHKGLRRAHRPGVLSGGAKFVKTSVDPDEAQMLESRMFAVEEVCRAFRIPVAMLQSTRPGAQAYSSREQDAIQFATYTLMPYITAIEGHLSRLLPGGAFVKFNMDGLLRASLTERYSAYSQGIQSGFLSINDIHRLEDMRPVDGGDEVRVPLANVNLSAANVTEQQMRVEMAQNLINAGFAPAAALSAVGLPAIEHTGMATVQLQVDVEPVDPADDPAEDSAEETPTRTVRSVVRDAAGFITAIVDEEL